jgi:hypothetical protein
MTTDPIPTEDLADSLVNHPHTQNRIAASRAPITDARNDAAGNVGVLLHVIKGRDDEASRAMALSAVAVMLNPLGHTTDPDPQGLEMLKMHLRGVPGISERDLAGLGTRRGPAALTGASNSADVVPGFGQLETYTQGVIMELVRLLADGSLVIEMGRPRNDGPRGFYVKRPDTAPSGAEDTGDNARQQTTTTPRHNAPPATTPASNPPQTGGGGGRVRRGSGSSAPTSGAPAQAQTQVRPNPDDDTQGDDTAGQGSVYQGRIVGGPTYDAVVATPPPFVQPAARPPIQPRRIDPGKEF